MAEAAAETPREPRRPYAIAEYLTPGAASARQEDGAQDLYDFGDGGTVRVHMVGDDPKDLARVLGSDVVGEGHRLSVLTDPEVVGPMLKFYRNRYKQTSEPGAQA